MKVPACSPLVAALLALLASPLSAEVVFSALDLDPQSRLVFAARAVWAGTDYQVWFRSDLTSTTPPVPLTFYPESASWLPALGQLQIRNRFGVWRLDPGTGRSVSVSPWVFGKDPGAGDGRPLPLVYAPDGRTVLSYKPLGPVMGDLEWRDVDTMVATTVSTGLALGRTLPALWSPDGQFFVYEKRGELYYYSLRQARDGRVPEENLRKLGPGLISSVTWGAGGDLAYVSDQVLYRILPEEFFTRSLYRAQFQTWGITGKLPFPFRPASDRFWLAPDGKSVLFSLGGRTLFVYPLEYLDFYQSSKLTALTYLPLPQSLSLTKVVWTRDGRITVLATSLRGGQEQPQVFRVSAASVQQLDPGPGTVLDLAPSPDESLLLVVRRDGISVRDPATFAERRAFALDGTVAAAWVDASTLIATGRGATQTFALADGTVRTLALGSLDQVGDLETGQLVGRQGSRWYVWQPAAGPVPGWWKPAAGEFTLPAPVTANAAYRAFLGDQPSGPWRNAVLIRDLKALTTKALLVGPDKAYEAFPAAEAGPDDPGGDGVDQPFRHGSRVRAREVALAIDAVDSSEGLPEVLRALKEYGFQATFFVNGEFLRRNPQASQEIAASGHEVANLFHIPLDLTSPGFIIDAAFVTQGLARQEDDWFSVTGKELGLLWHAPGWVNGPALIAGAKAANYRTVGTDLAQALAPGRLVDTPAWISGVLAAKKPGSIVPLTLGMKDSTTGESFFNRWDLLLNGLAEAGYRGVTVTQLMDRSRP